MNLHYSFINNLPLFQKHPHHLFFQSGIFLIPDRQIHPRFLIDNTAVMAEGFKPNPAVVAAHAALTDTAEWHIARCKMNDRVIDTAAAKTAGI